MNLRRFNSQLAFLLTLIVLPVTSYGASTLPVEGEAILSRGDFLRAAITELKLPFTAKSIPKETYNRVIPKALQPYVNAGERQNALKLFGKDLSLSKSITRGEAATVLAALLHFDPTGPAMSFTDVTEGTPIERGVRTAVERGWMQPVKSTLFGADRVLTSKEAKDMLQKASGSSTGNVTSTPKVPAITIKYKTAPKVDIPENALLRTIWQLMKQQYLYTDKINDKEAGYKAAEALVNSIGDPYTVFMRPVDAKQFQSQIDGQVSGIGAQVEYHDNALTVISPISGSPSQKAGLKAGDIITKVDGVSLAGMNLVEAVDKVRGPKGTVVKLTITRNGTEMTIEVTRDTVKLPEIDISMQDGIAIVRLVQFGQTTDTQLRALMSDLAGQKPKGIVLDLRNNPGGLLHAAEITLSNFLPEGSGVAQIASKTEDFTEVTTDKPAFDNDTPMVVLINKGSASASEIVAGALQDYKRAILVGEKSFGKGTVQQIIEFQDGSSVKMTIAEWLTPKGRVINKVGIEPDVPVAAGDGTRDEQLLKALDLLR